MKYLSVKKCPELKEIPLQLRKRETFAEVLPYIWVEGNGKWKTLMWHPPLDEDTLRCDAREGFSDGNSFWELYRTHIKGWPLKGLDQLRKSTWYLKGTTSSVL